MSVPEKKTVDYMPVIKVVENELSKLDKQINEKQELILENRTRIQTERKKTLPEVCANLKANTNARDSLLAKRPYWVSKCGEEFVANEISACEQNIQIAKASMDEANSTIATSEFNIRLAQKQLEDLQTQKARFITSQTQLEDLQKQKADFTANQIQLYGFFIDSKPSKYILAISAEKEKETQLNKLNLIQKSPQIRR